MKECTQTNEHNSNQIKIQNLSNEQLLQHLQRLLNYEMKLNQALLFAMTELQSRKLYLELGFSSLFEMLVKHFKLSESLAYQRISTMKLINSVPITKDLINEGNLSLTNAALVQSFIAKVEQSEDKKLTINEKQDIIQAVCNKTQKQAQGILAEIHPVATLPKIVEKQITSNLTQIQIILDSETMLDLQQLKSLYSHQIPDGNLNQLFTLIITNAVKNHPLNRTKYQKIKNTPENYTHAEELKNDNYYLIDLKNANEDEKNNIIKLENSNNQTSTINKNLIHGRRNISLKTKRIIFTKASGQCEYRSPEGNRCQSRHRLEYDHIISVSQGGTNSIENLQLLCRHHNQYKVLNTHGFLYQKKISTN